MVQKYDPEREAKAEIARRAQEQRGLYEAQQVEAAEKLEEINAVFRQNRLEKIQAEQEDSQAIKQLHEFMAEAELKADARRAWLGSNREFEATWPQIRERILNERQAKHTSAFQKEQARQAAKYGL